MPSSPSLPLYEQQHQLEAQLRTQIAQYFTQLNGTAYHADEIILTDHEHDSGYDISLPHLAKRDPDGTRENFAVLQAELGAYVESVEHLGMQAVGLVKDFQPIQFLRCNAPELHGVNPRRHQLFAHDPSKYADKRLGEEADLKPAATNAARKSRKESWAELHPARAQADAPYTTYQQLRGRIDLLEALTGHFNHVLGLPQTPGSLAR